MSTKYTLNSEENKEFLKENAEELLTFGKKFPSPQGSAWYLDENGEPEKSWPRQTWITCRMIHSYSLGAALGYPGSEALIDAGLRGLKDDLRDQEHGGWFIGKRADGTPLQGKQCYSHAFVILAGTSAYLAGRPGAEELLKEALEVYDRYFWDEEEGMARDTWDTSFTTCSDYRGVNSNMHSTEAFLAAADVLGDEKYRIRAGRIIAHVIAWAKENEWRIPEHFSKDWQPELEFNKEKPDDPFKPYGATPGHGIEWARLITQWAVSSFGAQNPAAFAFIDAAENLYERAVQDGWTVDRAPGFCYTTDWEGNPIVHDRMHWTLAEAINTAAVLYRVTGNEQYKADFALYMDYLDHMVLDHENGSWFHQQDKDGKVLTTVWPGKPDIYHALQAMLIPYSENVGVSIAKALRMKK